MLRGWLLIAVLVSGAGSAAAGDLEALDAENGFRDARFGAPVESFDDLELISENGARGTRVYVRRDDALSLGDAALDGITYGFHQGRLYFVALLSSGRRNARAVLAELERAYGPGERLDGEAREFLWQGRQVSLHFREDPTTAMGMVGITSLVIDAELKAERASLPARIAPQRSAEP